MALLSSMQREQFQEKWLCLRASNIERSGGGWALRSLDAACLRRGVMRVLGSRQASRIWRGGMLSRSGRW